MYRKPGSNSIIDPETGDIIENPEDVVLPSEEQVNSILEDKSLKLSFTILPNSQAHKAGLRSKDELVSINGKRIHCLMDYANAVSIDPKNTNVIVIRNKSEVLEFNLPR